MGDVTLIEWADRTFNPWEGCQKVGPGCDNCYAETRNARWNGGEATNWGPGAPRRRTSASNWSKPRRWDREQAAALAADPKAPPMFVFCASLADVFDNAVPVEWRRDLFDLIRATPNLTWLLLTKRPGNIEKLFREAYGAGVAASMDVWPRNAAIGCTVVNQAEADREVEKLLKAKAALRPAFAFLSLEPLLGPVDLAYPVGLWPDGPPRCCSGADCGCQGMPTDPPLHWGVDWVIVGGESGANARPMSLDWARSIRDQVAGTPTVFNFKQVGGRTADKGGHELDGRLYLDRPAP